VLLPRAKFKSEVHFSNAYVIYPKQLKQVLEQHRTSEIDGETKQQLIRKLETVIVKNKQQQKEIKKRHVQTIQTKRKQEDRYIQQNRCPKCGSALVIKNGKYGKFKCCSTYPKCRFTQKIR
jgi:uncharacterized protein YycO